MTPSLTGTEGVIKERKFRDPKLLVDGERTSYETSAERKTSCAFAQP